MRLCDSSVGGEYWGANNADPRKLSTVAEYLAVNHTSLDCMGKGMLIAFACASASQLLTHRALTTQETRCLQSILIMAVYDIELASYVWYFVDDADLSDPFTAWLNNVFPGWKPRHWP
jgi:hypothetical protein